MEKLVNTNDVCISIGNSMADIQIGDKTFKTSFNPDLKYIDLSTKLSKLVEKEHKRTTNPLQSLFAFGDSFRMDVVNILKGRV